MDPFSLFNYLSIDDVVGSSANDLTINKSNLHSKKLPVQIIILDEMIGEAINRALADLQFPFTKVILSGISVLKNGTSFSDIIPVLKSNLDANINTIVIGGKNQAFKACFDTFQFREKYFNASIIQPSAGTGIDKTILEVKRPWLQGLFLLANQAHLSNQNFLSKGENEGLRSVRLGNIRMEPGCVEPEIRSSDLVGISLNALKNCEAGIQHTISATGLTTEEACQLIYYAGRADCNKITAIFDFHPGENLSGINLLSTLIWYYLHGLNFRSGTYPVKTSGMKKFTIDHLVHNKMLTFYKDETEQKWWLDCPFKKQSLSKEMPYIACDYQDYRHAANDELLTERLMNWFYLYETSGTIEGSSPA